MKTPKTVFFPGNVKGKFTQKTSSSQMKEPKKMT